MTKFEMRRLYLTVTYLLACALNDAAPKKELIPEKDVDVLYRYAKHHSVGALVSLALEKVGMAPAESIAERNMAIRKTMLLDAGRAELFSRFRENGIRYMPLKGVIIKELYPSIGLRQMSDNDILIDPEYRERARDIMVELGYTVDHYMRNNHDVYTKAPVYNYEIHISLFELSNRKTFAEYFDDVFGAGVQDERDPYLYSMTDEYYYLYMKAHEYKHHTNGGTGIRSLLDTYVFLRAKESSLDRTHLEGELSKLEILDYERDTRALALKIFDTEFSERNLREYLKNRKKPSDLLSDDERIFLDEFFLAGTYGTVFTMLKNSLDQVEKEGDGRLVKLKYIFGKVFRNADFYKENYPFLYKTRILLPVAVLCRLCSMVFLRPKSSFKHLFRVIKFKRRKKK